MKASVRLDAAVGFRPDAHLQRKIHYSLPHEQQGRCDIEHLGAVQWTVGG